jgi:hypothetical protein
LALLAIVLVPSLTFVSGASAQEQLLVCYLSGLNWVGDPIVPNGSVATSYIYNPDGSLFLQRDVVMQSSQYGLNWGFLPVFAPRGGFEIIIITVPIGTFGFGPYAVNSYIRPDDECAVARIGDGRINDGGAELGAPLAAYCADNAGITVYDIAEDGTGQVSFRVTGEEIAGALRDAADTATPLLVGEAGGNQLWASPDHILAVLGPEIRDPGKIYRYDFAGDTCGTVDAPAKIPVQKAVNTGVYSAPDSSPGVR